MDLLVGCQVSILKSFQQDLHYLQVINFLAYNLDEAIKSSKHGNQICDDTFKLKIDSFESLFVVSLVIVFDKTQCLSKVSCSVELLC